jgi:hypothetical protein
MMTQIIGLLAVLLCIGLSVLFIKRIRRGGFVVANIGEGRHTTGNISKLTDAAHTTRYLVVKRGTDDGHVAIANAQTDVPYGVATDEADAAEKPVNIFVCGPGEGTVFMVCNAALAIGDWLFVGAGMGGKVDKIAGVAGTYFPIGRALTATSAQGDLVEVATHPAIKFVQ